MLSPIGLVQWEFKKLSGNQAHPRIWLKAPTRNRTSTVINALVVPTKAGTPKYSNSVTINEATSSKLKEFRVFFCSFSKDNHLATGTAVGTVELHCFSFRYGLGIPSFSSMSIVSVSK